MADEELRQRIRKLRDAGDDEEDSTVTIVDQHGRKLRVRSQSHAEIHMPPNTVRPTSEAPRKTILVTVLTLLPPWGRVMVALAVIASMTYGGHQLGWW